MKMEQEREYFDALEKWSIAMHQEDMIGCNSDTIAATKLAKVEALRLRGATDVPKRIADLDLKIQMKRKQRGK
jgi:hypothetical protein